MWTIIAIILIILWYKTLKQTLEPLFGIVFLLVALITAYALLYK